jgi:hypothetical protein
MTMAKKSAPKASNKAVLADSKANGQAAGKKFEKNVEVDFWSTNLHEEEIGIYKQERYQAKNRSFNKDLELVGSVKEEGKDDGIFGINESSWNEVSEKQLGNKRLVIKWFSKDSVNHIGTIEQIVLSSIHASMAAEDEIPVFKMVVPGYDFLVDVKKEHPRVPKIGEIYGCSFKGRDETWHPVLFVEKPVAIGSDWDVVIGDSKKIVANIDEKLLNVGGKFVVSYFDKNLYDDATFYKIIILFSMMCKYRAEIIDQIKKIREIIDSGKSKIDISSEEEKLFRNPRLIKMT